MVTSAINMEERTGLIVAIAAHLMLLAILVFRPVSGEIVLPPERIEVTLSDEVGLISTSPDPFTSAAPDVAPTIGERLQEVVQPEPEPEPAPLPTVAAVPEPRPAPVARSRPTPRPVSRPNPPPRRVARPQPRPSPPARTGGSRVGNDFLEGSPSSAETGTSSSQRAATIGPRERSALRGAIVRQLKPHWSSPQGPEVENIVTILSWSLNRDGSLAGTPSVVGQRGVNEVNQAQASRHAEQAIRAVQLAAPFNLPSEFYDGWKRIQFEFDKSLSR